MARQYALYGGNLAYWHGGRWLLRLFARALAQRCAGRSGRVVVVLPRNSPVDDAIRVAGWTLHGAAAILRGRRPAPLLLRRASAEALDPVTAGIEGPIEAVYCAPFLPALAARLRSCGADVLLPSAAVLPQGFPVPWVGYIPDMQHRHFPELFTAPEIAYRDRQFRLMLDRAPCVIVNAAAVKEDLARFFPDARARIFGLPFAPTLDVPGDAPSADEVLARMGVDSPFFLISNQFWVHKNHLTAFRALRRLAQAYGRPDVQLVCTGATSDYRSAGYFRDLTAELEALGIRARVVITGYVPRAEYLALMTRAVAVVQPTLFEGGPGGGAAYDAASLGVPLLASDIPVNREIDSEAVFFFPPRDEGALADLMAKALAAPAARPTQEALRRRSRERSARLGDSLAEAAEFAISSYET